MIFSKNFMFQLFIMNQIVPRHYFSIHTPAFEKWPIPLKVAAPTFKYQYTSDAYISELEWYINYKMCES